MTTKGYIILSGSDEAKKVLRRKLQNDYWVWNVSTLRNLKHSAKSLGWQPFDENDGSEFIEQMMELSNDYFDYEFQHVVHFMEKTDRSTKAQENGKKGDLLLVEVDRDLSDRLQNYYSFYELHVTDCSRQVIDNFEDGRYVLGMNDDEKNIEDAIENILQYVCVDKNKEKIK